MNRVIVGLCLACGLCARAETVDEAIGRLAKAAESVKDLAAKWDLVKNDGDPKSKAPKRITVSAGVQMLNDGGKQLFRTASLITQEGYLPGDAKAKMQVARLVVFDGETVWVEDKTPILPQPTVAKIKMDSLNARLGTKGPGMGLGIEDVKQAIGQMREMFELKLVGTGHVLGRATTRIEAVPKAEMMAKLPEMARTLMPARLVTDYDDATGTPLLQKGFNAKGEETMTTTVTDLKANTGIDKGIFTYAPPPGVNVEDLSAKLPAGSSAPQPPKP